MINHMMCLFLYIYIYMCVCCDLLCYKLRVIKGGGGDVAISGRELPVDYRGLFESPTLANKPYEHVTPFPYLYLYLPPSTADATAWGLSCARLTHTLGQIQQFSAATSNYELIIVSDDNRSVARRDTLNAGAVAWAVALGWGGGQWRQAVSGGVVREGGGLLGRFAVGVCVGANSAKNAYSGGGCPGECVCVCHVSVCTGYLLTLIANEFPSIFSFAFSCFVLPLFACKSRVGQGKERQGRRTPGTKPTSN